MNMWIGSKIKKISNLKLLQDDVKVNILTLSFGGELEREFRETSAQSSLRQMRAALFLAIFIYGAFGILDAAIFPALSSVFLFIRLAIVIPFITLVYLFSFHRKFLKYSQICVSLVSLVAGLAIISMIVIAPQPINASYYAGLILVFLYGYTFFRLRFVWATLSCWMIVIGYEVAALFLTVTPLATLISNNLFFSGVDQPDWPWLPAIPRNIIPAGILCTPASWKKRGKKLKPLTRNLNKGFRREPNSSFMPIKT